MNEYIKHENVLAWLIPALLGIAVAVLGWMAVEISSMSNSLAVAVYKIDDHERRLDALEDTTANYFDRLIKQYENLRDQR